MSQQSASVFLSEAICDAKCIFPVHFLRATHGHCHSDPNSRHTKKCKRTNVDTENAILLLKSFFLKLCIIFFCFLCRFRKTRDVINWKSRNMVDKTSVNHWRLFWKICLSTVGTVTICVNSKKYEMYQTSVCSCASLFSEFLVCHERLRLWRLQGSRINFETIFVLHMFTVTLPEFPERIPRYLYQLIVLGRNVAHMFAGDRVCMCIHVNGSKGWMWRAKEVTSEVNVALAACTWRGRSPRETIRRDGDPGSSASTDWPAPGRPPVPSGPQWADPACHKPAQ